MRSKIINKQNLIDDTSIKLVSIVAPVYNCQRFLPNFLDSVSNLTYPNYEIILIDDGSTDDSPKMLDDYAKINKKARVIHIQNQGVSHARNLGIQSAKGNYVYFADSDDILHPNIVDILLQAMLETHADVSVCNYKIINKQKKHPKPLKEGKKIKLQIYDDAEESMALMLGNGGRWGIPWNKLFRKEIFEKCIWYPKIFPEEIYVCEDMLANFRYFTKVKRAVVVPKKLYFYRFIKKGAHNKFDAQKDMTLTKVVDEIKDYDWSQYQNIEKYVYFACALFSMFFLWKIAHSDIQDDKIPQYYDLFKNWVKYARKCKLGPRYWRYGLCLTKPYIHCLLKTHKKLPKKK